MPAAPPSADDRDLVVLRVPADPGYARVVRVAVSAYAVRLGLAPAAVEDLRLAVDEALILLMGASDGAEGPAERGGRGDGAGGEQRSIVVTLDAAGDRPPVSVELHLDPPTDLTPPDAAARSRFEEIVPAGVAIEALDQGHGRIALRHPA